MEVGTDQNFLEESFTKRNGTRKERIGF